MTHRSGFSLIELQVVMAMIGIWAGIAIPRVANSIAHHRVDAAARRIAADLELARQYAIHSSTIQTVTFSGDGYVLSGMRDLNRSTSSYKVDLSAAPYRAQILIADFAGDSEVGFDVYGNADSGGTVIVQVAGWQHTVTFDPESGKATVE